MSTSAPLASARGYVGADFAERQRRVIVAAVHEPFNDRMVDGWPAVGVLLWILQRPLVVDRSDTTPPRRLESCAAVRMASPSF